MRRTRVIPVLLLRGGGIYKTVEFGKPLYIGDPLNTIRLFNDLEVDELVILDINASKENTCANLDLLGELASEAFMPVGYGGGIKTVDHVSQVLRLGIEKIILNHALYKNPGLITECANRFGSQSVVVNVNYVQKMLSGRRIYDHVSGKTLTMTPIEAAVQAVKLGAGEVLLTSVDRDGKMQGMDVSMIADVSKNIVVPLIACGGAGSLEHLRDAQMAGASAIAAGSMFVFRGKQRGILISYPPESELKKYLI
jgi:cyclase